MKRRECHKHEKYSDITNKQIRIVLPIHIRNEQMFFELFFKIKLILKFLECYCKIRNLKIAKICLKPDHNLILILIL